MSKLDQISAGFIHGREGLRLQAYDDHDGKPLVRDSLGTMWLRPDGKECIGYATIGWGQRCWGPKYYGPCTRADADRWFDETVADFVATVDRYVTNANSYQRGAFVSFAYNAGSGGLIESGLMQLHKSGASLDEMKAAWLVARVKSKGVVSAGLKLRRAQEFAFYSTPVAGQDDPESINTEEILARVDASARAMVGEFV